MCAYILIIKAHAYLILARSTAILWVPRRYVLCKKKKPKTCRTTNYFCISITVNFQKAGFCLYINTVCQKCYICAHILQQVLSTGHYLDTEFI